jgi:hypothetical protein
MRSYASRVRHSLACSLWSNFFGVKSNDNFSCFANKAMSHPTGPISSDYGGTDAIVEAAGDRGADQPSADLFRKSAHIR